MKNIKKALKMQIINEGPKVSKSQILEKVKNDPNGLVDILFLTINEHLDNYDGAFSLDSLREILDYIEDIIKNCDKADRKIILRKLHKLDEKIDRIQIERKKYFLDFSKIKEEFSKTQEKISKIEVSVIGTDTKQYDFLDYLINIIKSPTYIDYVISKMPNIVNAKDKDKNTIFRNVVENYLIALKNTEDEDTKYYNNIISLIISSDSFNITNLEKQDILEDIYKCLNSLSLDKKSTKRNKDKIINLKKLIETIKNINEIKTDIYAIANQYNVPINFPEYVDQILELRKVPTEKEERYYVDDYVITIDSENAHEIDDALSCRKLPNGNYLLGVHIASILSYFPYDSEIVEQAINRSKSIYLSKKYKDETGKISKLIPQFPYEFSTNYASLIPNQPRYTRTYYFEISPSGEIVNEKFLKSIIKSNKQTTYKEVNKVLKHGTEDENLSITINNLQKVSEILEKIYKPTTFYEQVKENTTDYSELRVKQIGAEKIVYQIMLLTGNRVADYFAKSKEGYPCLYRVHEINEDNVRKLEAMVKNLSTSYGGKQYEKIYKLIEGIYPKGWYAIDGSHYGLNLEHYCHCTSGLRRSADIVVEHALNVCYDKNPTDQEIEELRNYIKNKALQINSQNDTIDYFVKEYDKTYKLKRR